MKDDTQSPRRVERLGAGEVGEKQDADGPVHEIGRKRALLNDPGGGQWS